MYSRFSEIPYLNSLICLILLNPLLLTPNTSDGAQHVPNLILKYPKFEKLNFNTFKGFLILTKVGKIG